MHSKTKTAKSPFQKIEKKSKTHVNNIVMVSKVTFSQNQLSYIGYINKDRYDRPT